jgi:hypothetical protein
MLAISVLIASLRIRLDLYITDISLIIREVLGLEENWPVNVGLRIVCLLKRLNLENNFSRI